MLDHDYTYINNYSPVIPNVLRAEWRSTAVVKRAGRQYVGQTRRLLATSGLTGRRCHVDLTQSGQRRPSRCHRRLSAGG